MRGLMRPGPHRVRLQRVIGISFPRSGHHCLEGLLRQYFGCAWSYCETYGMCTQDRCINDAVYQKNHDFGLTLHPRRPVLVQVREPEPAIQSLFELEVGLGTITDDEESWLRFSADRLAFYRRWCERWIHPDHFVIHYEALMAEPAVQLARAVRLFEDREPHMPTIASIVARSDVRQRRDVTAFRYGRLALEPVSVEAPPPTEPEFDENEAPWWELKR